MRTLFLIIFIISVSQRSWCQTVATPRTELITEVNPELSPVKTTVYPNPVENTLYWQGVEDFNQGRYRIINVLGQVIAEGYVKTDHILVSQLTTGWYVLELHYFQDVVRIPFVKK